MELNDRQSNHGGGQRRVRGHALLFASLFTGVAFGIAVWALLYAVAGDADLDTIGHFFYPALIVAGALATVLRPAEFWPAPVGVALGLFVYAALMPGPLDPLAMVVVLWGLAMSLIGSLAIHVGWRVWRENLNSHGP